MFIFSFFLLNQISVLADEPLPTPQELICSQFEAKSPEKGQIQFTKDFQVLSYSGELLISRELLGDKMRASLSDCRLVNESVVDPDDLVKLNLFGTPTRAMAFRIVLRRDTAVSNRMFLASNLAQARTTASWFKELQLVDSRGTEFEAGIFFRKRMPLVWEFYLLLPSFNFSNTIVAQASDTVIVELGSMRFKEDGSLEELRFWHGEPDDENARFFQSYIPEDFEAVPAGKALIRSDGIAEIRWKDSDSTEHLWMDFGQLGSEGAEIKEDATAKGSRLIKFVHDGRAGPAFQNPSSPDEEPQEPLEPEPEPTEPETP